MVVIVMLGVAVWLAVPMVLSRAMRRLGYARSSYWLVGAGGYDVVVTARPDPILSARLTEAGRIHCCGDEVRLFGSGRFPLSCWPGGTEALAPSPAARIRPARTA
jgi:hypothetical protein